MNKIKGTIAARIVAWVLLTISVAVMAGGCFLCFYADDLGVYTSSVEEIRKEAFEQVSNNYSVTALAHRGKNYNNDDFADTSFRYGIIKADSLDGLDLNDDSIYEEKNFTEKVSLEDVYLYRANIGENTGFYYSSSFIDGSYGIYNNTEYIEETVKIQRTCYDNVSGIFYYEAGGSYYPIEDVSITLPEIEVGQWAQYMFWFDPQWNGYFYNGRTSVGGEATGSEPVAEESQTSALSEDNKPWESEDSTSLHTAPGNMMDEELLFSDSPITFNQLFEGMEQSIGWREIELDGKVYTDDRQISYISITAGKTDKIVQNTTFASYTVENGTELKVQTEKEPDTQTYWVVSIMPESVGTGSSRDQFVQANTIVSLTYTLRYSIFMILPGALILFFSSLIFLFCAAGHRKNTSEIVLSWIDKIPLDLYFVITFAIVFFLCLFSAECCYYTNNVVGIYFLLLALWCTCAISLASILSLAVRIKAGNWWKNTIIYRCLRWIKNVLNVFGENISLLWKAIMIMAVISLIEVFVILLTNYDVGIELLLWMLEKLVLGAVIFISLIQMSNLQKGSKRIAEGDLKYQINTSKMFWEFKKHGDNLNRISEGMSRAVDEQMKSERFKTELITNVSHDIKTPLTSIINYVDLLEKEELGNKNAVEYLEVLERQSARLKKLIEDLMEASKASTGNLAVNMERLEAGVFMVQTVGEFEEKTSTAELELIIQKPEEPVYIIADGRHFWRVIDNLMNNVCKYAQPGTRVYINLETKEEAAYLTFRNTSKYPLNISSGELMERFVRGDDSRNTEGSGLGLSIAKSLMDLMHGEFELYVDGDLFKVVLVFQITS